LTRRGTRHLHVLLHASALLAIFAAQLLRRLAFLDEQGKRRIFVVYDLLVLDQLEKAIIRHIFALLIIPAPEQHREREKAEGDRDEGDAAPIKARFGAALLVVALGVTIVLWHE